MTASLSPSLGLAPQEPAFSFLSRLAALHDVGAADFAEDMGLGFANIVAGRPTAVRALADLAGVSQDELGAWTPTYVGSRAHLFRGEKFHARGLHSTSVSGCPACLRSDASAAGESDIGAMTIRAPWLVRHVTICLVHQLPLVELWKVRAPNERHDTTARLREIAPSLLSGQMDEKARPPSEFDRWMWARLTGQKGDLWLDQFALYPAAHFCELLGRAAYATRIPKWKKFAPQDLHWSTRAGFQIASQGEKQIRSALTEMQEKVGNAEDGPKKKFGDLYDRLAHDLVGEDYAPFRELLRDHIATTWALGPGDTLMGEPVLVRHKHSVLTAARETGTDPRRMRKLLIEKGFLNEAELVRMTVGRYLMRRLRRAFSLSSTSMSRPWICRRRCVLIVPCSMACDRTAILCQP